MRVMKEFIMIIHSNSLYQIQSIKYSSFWQWLVITLINKKMLHISHDLLLIDCEQSCLLLNALPSVCAYTDRTDVQPIRNPTLWSLRTFGNICKQIRYKIYELAYPQLIICDLLSNHFQDIQKPTILFKKCSERTSSKSSLS